MPTLDKSIRVLGLMVSLMKNMSNIQNRLVAPLLAALVLVGCSGGDDSTEMNQAELANDTAFAYVERTVSSESQANIDKYSNALAGKTEAPLDGHTPYQFRPGAKLVVQSSLDVDAFTHEVLDTFSVAQSTMLRI